MENVKSFILKDICKSFGEKSVLLGINLSFARGKVYALLGENGSGKSTLAKILSGEIKADCGKIFGISDNSENSEYQIELKINSPKDSLKYKIGIVSQNPTVCKDLQVWENIFLGDGKTLSPFFANKKKFLGQIENQLLDLGFSLDLKKKGKDCRASEKFFVCLARALFLEKDILILDEPTASLSKNEKEILFNIIKRFKNAGKIVVLITHNREEALSLADEVVFLQKGKAPLVGKEARKRLEGFSFGGAGGAQASSENVASRESSVSLGEFGVQAGSENAASRENSVSLGESAVQAVSENAASRENSVSLGEFGVQASSENAASRESSVSLGETGAQAGSENAASRESSAFLGESGVQAGSENVTSQGTSRFLGKSATQVNSKKSPIFAVKNLCAYETPLSRIENLSFAVEAGKITCVKGQWETGLSLLEDVVSGMKTFSKGEIFFAGKWYKEKDKFDTRLLRQKGTSIIPSDKINRGAPKSLKVEELFLVAKQNQGKNLFQGKDLISQAKVDAKLSNKVSSLSGGMLQRLILRRELSLGSDFYIFSNPTSGLDFAGIRDLISTLKNLTEKGKGILVLSVDDTEIEKICDFCIALDWKTDLEKNRK